jgi:hypothetical protein
MVARMLLKFGTKSAVSWLILLGVLPSLFLNVGSGRALLIHDHEHEEAHAHVITAHVDAEHDHEQGEQAADYLAFDQRETNSRFIVLGNELARPKHSAATDAPAVVHTLPALPSILITIASPPESCSTIGDVGAGPPNVSLAFQTCVQILI